MNCNTIFLIRKTDFNWIIKVKKIYYKYKNILIYLPLDLHQPVVLEERYQPAGGCGASLPPHQRQHYQYQGDPVAPELERNHQV